MLRGVVDAAVERSGAVPKRHAEGEIAHAISMARFTEMPGFPRLMRRST
jgi:hypothetical protein